MDKMYSFIITLIGLSLLFTVIGIPTGVGMVASTFGITGTAVNYDASAFALKLGLLISLGVGIGIVVGLFTQGKSDGSILINAGLLGLLATFVTDFTSVVSYCSGNYGANSFATWVVALVMLPLLGGFLWSIIDVWRGKD